MVVGQASSTNPILRLWEEAEVDANIGRREEFTCNLRNLIDQCRACIKLGTCKKIDRRGPHVPRLRLVSLYCLERNC